MKIVTPILIGTVPLANYQSTVASGQQNDRIKQNVNSEGFPPCAAVYYTAAVGSYLYLYKYLFFCFFQRGRRVALLVDVGSCYRHFPTL